MPSVQLQTTATEHCIPACCHSCSSNTKNCLSSLNTSQTYIHLRNPRILWNSNEVIQNIVLWKGLNRGVRSTAQPTRSFLSWLILSYVLLPNNSGTFFFVFLFYYISNKLWTYKPLGITTQVPSVTSCLEKK